MPARYNQHSHTPALHGVMLTRICSPARSPQVTAAESAAKLQEKFQAALLLAKEKSYQAKHQEQFDQWCSEKVQVLTRGPGESTPVLASATPGCDC